ncbi:Rpn family recombination-promoting nuclease/putative transposase [Erwinia amylovora]
MTEHQSTPHTNIAFGLNSYAVAAIEPTIDFAHQNRPLAAPLR